MGQADLEINRRTRSVFVRHWIDLGLLSLRSVNNRITIRGSLNRIFGQREELTPALVEGIFNEIRRIPGVKHVSPALDNWSNASSTWQKVGAQRKRDPQKAAPGAEPGEQETYVIDED